MNNVYQELDYLLKQKRIYSSDDVIKLNLPRSHPNLITSCDYDGEWISEMIYIIQILAKEVENNIATKGGQFFCVENDTESVLNISKYMCFFPERGLIKTFAPDTVADEYNIPDVYSSLPKDYFHKYFAYKELISNGIISLYPATNPNIYSNPVFEIQQYDNVSFLSSCGNGYKNYSKKEQGLFMAFPWIYSARIEDYIDLYNKYNLEFHIYNNTISKIAHESKNINNFNETVLLDAQKAFDDIALIFKQKKKDLLRKGITSTVGIALTFIPSIIPNLSTIIDPQLFSAFIGGGTLFESLKICNGLFEIKELGKENPFWVIWKWMQTTKT